MSAAGFTAARRRRRSRPRRRPPRRGLPTSGEWARGRRWSRWRCAGREARRPENSAGRSVSGWAKATGSGACQASAERARLVPGEAVLFEQVAGLLAQPCHRRRGEPAAVPDRPRRRLEPEHREQRFVEALSGPPPKSRGELHGPAAPHRAELDERAVLVEDDQVDPLEEDRHTSSTTASVARTSSRAAPSTKQASGGNDTVTGKPTPGSDRCGSLNVSSAMTLGG